MLSNADELCIVELDCLVYPETDLEIVNYSNKVAYFIEIPILAVIKINLVLFARETNQFSFIEF